MLSKSYFDRIRAAILPDREGGTGCGVYGMKFVVETYHKPLAVIYGPRSRTCARIERWVLRLQLYDFSVIHRPGCENIAEPLSQLLHRKAEPDNHQRCTKSMLDLFL